MTNANHNANHEITDESDSEMADVCIRAKWSMDGAATLTEAAERLEQFAARLRQEEQAGWQLIEPVADDYGFLAKRQ